MHAPLLGVTYTASKGGGAFANGDPLTVSERDAERAICATGFPFRAKADRLDEYLPVFEAALRRFEDLRRAGSASLDLAWTAAGVFDGYFEQALGPWDVAAGALLVREAGGVVTDWSGDDRAWLSSGDIVAGPPAVHAAMLELTRRLRAEPVQLAERHGAPAARATFAERRVDGVGDLEQSLLCFDEPGEPVRDDHHHEAELGIGERPRRRHATVAEHAAARPAREVDRHAEAPGDVLPNSRSLMS